MAQEIRKGEVKGAVTPRYADPFAAMRAEVEHVFDSFLGRGLGGLPSSLRSGEGGIVIPSIDVRETDKEVTIEAELPGIDEKDVSVTINNGVLTLKGEKKSEREEKKDDYHLTERSFGSFQRSFQVAESVDPDKVVASFDKGVLKISMPKKPEAAHAEKQIPIGKV